VESSERHGIPLTDAGRAIQAFEIDSEAAERAVAVVCETLNQGPVAVFKAPPGIEHERAEDLVKSIISLGSGGVLCEQFEMLPAQIETGELHGRRLALIGDDLGERVRRGLQQSVQQQCECTKNPYNKFQEE
jgi:hypothetical protein